jgi:demethylmenaquinone methyltransferase/2-methoxy-6-polyprenyl-1,4-benzoquinol methylase
MAKAEFVRVMFNDISHKYDLLNDVLSMGTHRLWKRNFVNLITKNKPKKVLDCATGTGDIAFLLEKKCSIVMGLDFSEKMIDEAKVRARKKGSHVGFMVGDIQKLPFNDKEFDATCISFGIRNVENLELGLKELGRVAKSVYILEFGQPRNELYSKSYFNMLKLYVPVFGAITKRSDAYEYLIDSSKRFPSDEKFMEILKRNTNFKNYKWIPVFGGIAYIYIGSDDEI